MDAHNDEEWVMFAFNNGRYKARLAETADDLAAAKRLRYLAFRGRTDDRDIDEDAFDDICDHVLVEDVKSGTLVCCFRMMILENGAGLAGSYSAQFYDLNGLKDFDGPMAEMGRFCIHPAWSDPDILRIAWGALTTQVDARGIELLFGCTSFQGTSEDQYLDAFSLLKDRHLAPKRWLPRVKAPRIFPFARALRRTTPNLRAATRAMPPLLRSYLMMGGWVSDHAVVDGDMDTLHVFTGVEISAIPPARARLLRAAAG